MKFNYPMQILKNHNLKSYTSFGIDAIARQFVTVTSISELKQAIALPVTPKFILGGGSNVLFCEDFAGLVIKVALQGIEVKQSEHSVHLHVAAGENWHDFVLWTLKHGYPGLENMGLIPGVVGAAPVQNIGAYGVELKDVCEYVDVLDIDSMVVERYSAEQCEFGYRDSIFKQALYGKVVIVNVGFKLALQWQAMANYGPLAALGENADAMSIFQQVCATRESKLPDPSKLGNAGSFFKNPVINHAQFALLQSQYPQIPNYPAGDKIKLAAGWLIDQCALKGFEIGGAQIHVEQALVIVNTGSAIARDIVDLAQHVQKSVLNKFNVKLEHEVRFMGKHGETSLAEVSGAKLGNVVRGERG